MRIYWYQFKSVVYHKWHVFLAGRLTGIPFWRLIIHDWSKFTPTELLGYAGNIGGSTNKQKWATAWLHHLHHNPHHPEHWVLSWRGNPKFYDDIGSSIAPFVTVLPMPETYVREMIADMMATGHNATGTWDISQWINDAGPDMPFHADTIMIMGKVLEEIGYKSSDNHDWSWVLL